MWIAEGERWDVVQRNHRRIVSMARGQGRDMEDCHDSAGVRPWWEGFGQALRPRVTRLPVRRCWKVLWCFSSTSDALHPLLRPAKRNGCRERGNVVVVGKWEVELEDIHSSSCRWVAPGSQLPFLQL